MYPHGQLAFAVQLAIDIELRVVRHVADVRHAEPANLCQRVLVC